MSKLQYMSAEGLEKLQQEFHQLKTVARREAAFRIETAKALGDLSENAEYHEAKDHLAFIEGRIMELDEMLKNVALIEEERGAKGVVRVGSTIVVNVDGKEKTFTIVGSSEADPTTGKISNESPIGSALLGAKLKETVLVTTPKGETEYVIVSIS
ncbi:MAG: transcription elongation factor GreA [Candidatus Uhrbacteria bacterium]|nr:transcription elongation factor GreA [Candidatus Uhrbacteria bacterium]